MWLVFSNVLNYGDRSLLENDSGGAPTTSHLNTIDIKSSKYQMKHLDDIITATSQAMTLENQHSETAVLKDDSSSTLKPQIHISNFTDVTSQTVMQNIKTSISHGRFVLCQSYWEQQSNSAINLFSFQKWAYMSGNFRVVEPFVTESVLEFPNAVLQNHEFTNSLRFRDYFDLDYWTRETAKKRIPPLYSWETFLKYASRKLIIAIPAYDASPGGVYVNDEINKNSGCRSEREKFYQTTGPLLKFLHFETIKTVCYAYWRSNNLPVKEVNSYLLSDDNATIWFGLWRGIEYGTPGMHSGRMPISDKVLQRSYGGIGNILSMIHPSPRILADSINYVKTKLKVDLRNYTAIHIRTVGTCVEKVIRGGHSKADVFNYFTKCAERLNEIIDKSGSTTYFLTTDLGKFGDQTGYKFDNSNSEKLLQRLIQIVYGNKTIDIYQKEFINSANGIKDRGYIASMQKTIAVNAKCLILMGGFSTFQKTILVQYKNGSHYNCVKYLCYQDPLHLL